MRALLKTRLVNYLNSSIPAGRYNVFIIKIYNVHSCSVPNQNSSNKQIDLTRGNKQINLTRGYKQINLTRGYKQISFIRLSKQISLTRLNKQIN